MRILLLLCSLLPALLYATEVYKSIAPDGSIIYSDQPSPDAARLRIDSAPGIASPPPAHPQAPPTNQHPQENDQPQRQGYLSLAIVSPLDDSVVRDDPGRLTLQVAVQPELDVQSGDRLVVNIDGARLPGRFTGDRLTLKNVDRGTHQLVVEIVDQQGKSLLSSDPVSIHMMRHSALKPNNALK